MKALLSKAAEYARASPGEVGLIAVLASAVLAASAFVVVRSSEPPAPEIKRLAASVPEEHKKLLVHVGGAVNAPGVYELANGSRVRDAIEVAGGTVEGADLDSLNLAAPVSDGEKVMVAKAGSVTEAQPTESGSSGAKVNLNNAGQPELEELPGVGPVTAQRILDYRRKKGRFTSVRQLLEVEGIGQKKFEALKDLVTV